MTLYALIVSSDSRHLGEKLGILYGSCPEEEELWDDRGVKESIGKIV